MNANDRTGQESPDRQPTRLLTDGGREPTIYAVEELPEDEKGGPCPMWPNKDGACGAPAEFVFVYEASLDPNDHRRKNCRCCADCKPVESVLTDGGTDAVLVPTVDRSRLHFHRERVAGIPECGPIANHYERRSREEAAEYAEPCSVCFSDELRADGGDQITACPECDSPNIKPRNPGKPSSPPSHTTHWYCNACGAQFDDARERPRHINPGGRSGLAGKLARADPDDLRADGGREIVYVRSQATGSGIDVYHTDRECNTLQQATQIIDRERRHVPADATECKHCRGELGGAENHEPDWEAQRVLREAEPGDLVTDGGQAWRPVGGDYVPEREAWLVLYARYSEDGWEYAQRVEEPDGTMLRSERGAVAEGEPDLRTDGGPELDDAELKRRARQSATGLIVWCRRADLDPKAVIDSVRNDFPTSTDGSRTWDHEDCPRDACDGELQQQDDHNVMCLSCEDVWGHHKNDEEHYLVSKESNIVARKPRIETDGGIDTDELSEEEIEAVVNTRMFQKALAYRRLADGISVLEDEDQVFESLVTSITNQHSSVTTAGSTREFFRLFREEVETFTEELTDEEEDGGDVGDLRDLVTDESGDRS